MNRPKLLYRTNYQPRAKISLMNRT